MNKSKTFKSAMLQKLFTHSEDKPFKEFPKALIISTLNEALDQFYILININQREGDILTDKLVRYESLDERFEKSKTKIHISELKNVNPNATLTVVLNTLINILLALIDELNTAGTYDTLKTCIEAIVRMREDDNTLKKQVKEKADLIHSLRTELENIRLNNTNSVYTTTGQVHQAKNLFEDTAYYNTLETQYLIDWERSRSEQNRATYTKKEDSYENEIQEFEMKYKSEAIAHREIMRYLEESKNDYLDDTQYWIKTYDTEIEKRDNELAVLRNDMEKLQEDHDNLEKLYNEHKIFVEERLEIKRIQRIKEEHELLLNWAATRIEAWWRGVMVRKKLGPFKPKKRKKKGKGKK